MTAVRFDPRARNDLREVALWYTATAPSEAARFLAEVRACAELIGRFPRLHAKRHGEVRLAALKVFPYNVWYLYEQVPDVATVVAVTHQRRNPETIGLP